MGQSCSICAHRDRDQINALLITGTPLRKIAERYGTSTTTLHRHKQTDLVRVAQKAIEKREAKHGDSVLEQCQSLAARSFRILDEAEAAKDPRTQLLAIREAKGVLELVGRITGELSPRSVPVNPQALFQLPPGATLAIGFCAPVDRGELGEVIEAEAVLEEEGQ